MNNSDIKYYYYLLIYILKLFIQNYLIKIKYISINNIINNNSIILLINRNYLIKNYFVDTYV